MGRVYVPGRPRRDRLLLFLCALVGASGSACTAPNLAFEPGADTRAPDAGIGPSSADLRADQPRDGGPVPELPVADAQVLADAAAPDVGPATDVALPATDVALPATDVALPATDVALPATDTPRAALLAHWALDQPPPAGSTSLIDPFGNTASLKGPITWPADYPPGTTPGRSLALNGGTSYVDVTLARSQQPTSTGAKTVALWFKGTDPTTTLRTMIALYNQGQQADVGLQLGVGETKIEGWPFGRSFRYLSTVIATPKGVWHHVAYTSSEGRHVLYIDGVETDSSTTWTVKPGVLDVMKLGTWNETRETAFFQGLMRDVRLYSEALSPAQVRSLAGLSP